MLKKLFWATITLATLFVYLPVHGQSDHNINLEHSRFFIDHAVFADSVQNRLEVYYKVFNDALNYVKKGDQYVANYEINIIVLGKKKRQVTGTSVERSYVLDEYAHTRSEEGFLINQVSLNLESGDYQLICKLIDHNSSDVSTTEIKVTSPDFNRASDISGIEFIQDIESTQVPSRFFKGESAAMPVVERSFDGDEERLGFYSEIYTSDYLGKELVLRFALEGKKVHPDWRDTSFVPGEDQPVRITEFIDLKGLLPGDYKLVLKLHDHGREIAQRSTDFIIRWSVSSLIKHNYKYVVEQLKYILTKNEKKALLDPDDSTGHQERFDAFWRGKDPTPGTPRNELKDEYYRRIRYADQYYQTINRKGWQTDRGMIYIKYGEPDQVDNHPFELGRKPYQIWYYFVQRRTFVFEDRRGDGDYQLQYPYDGDWSRYIGP